MMNLCLSITKTIIFKKIYRYFSYLHLIYYRETILEKKKHKLQSNTNLQFPDLADLFQNKHIFCKVFQKYIVEILKFN